MSVRADLSPAELQRFTRMETTTITPQPTPAECGFTSYGRDVAEAVRKSLGGSEWRAEARTPYWAHTENETHGELIIMVKVEGRWTRIVHTHRVPASTDRDLFTITVDGEPIRYALHRGDLPHLPESIALTVWRHVNDYPSGECVAVTCEEPPTVATYRNAMCRTHADRYAETGHW